MKCAIFKGGLAQLLYVKTRVSRIFPEVQAGFGKKIKNSCEVLLHLAWPANRTDLTSILSAQKVELIRTGKISEKEKARPLD